MSLQSDPAEVDEAIRVLSAVEPEDEQLRQRLKHWHRSEWERMKSGRPPEDYGWLDDLEPVPAPDGVEGELEVLERRLKVVQALVDDLGDRMAADHKVMASEAFTRR